MENINNTSESEQMYLVTIARLSELVSEYPVPISKVAEILDVTPISANQMIHRLEEVGFVTYTPYKGVEFTQRGLQTANQILRNRRLWQVFLVEHLHYAPSDAETLACRLEHAVTAETAERLAEFLGWPQVSPGGKPIPFSGADTLPHKGVPLSSLPAGKTGTVSAILAGEAERVFLQQSGLSVGVWLEVVGSQSNRACLINYGEGVLLNLSAGLAQKILVSVEN